jgi:hypothetical protein
MKHPTTRLAYMINLVVTHLVFLLLQNVLIARETANLSFSHQRGFYKKPFDLVMTSDLSNGSIHYTLDGSDPVFSPTVLSGSSPVTVLIDPTRLIGGRGLTPGFIVRAVVMEDTIKQTEVITHSYIFINAVATQKHPGTTWPTPPVKGQNWHYEMNPTVVNFSSYKNKIDDALLDIPSISLVTDLEHLFGYEYGIYVNAFGRGIEWERPASIELINPDGSIGFQINCGIRIRGGASRNSGYPKHAFRLFFRSEYGPASLRYPLFEQEGVDKFNKIDLRTSQNYAWSNGYTYENTMNRDVFSRELQREMEQPYTRSRYYHLYINGMYWGLYQTQERSEAWFAESYLGGAREDYDTVKPDEGHLIEATDGTLDAYSQIWEAAQKGFSQNQDYFGLEGRKWNGEIDPNKKKLVDIDNFIDFMIVIFYTGNFDTPVTKFGYNKAPNNFYALYNRNANEGFKFFTHDNEHTLFVKPSSNGPGIGIEENRVNIGELTDVYRMVVDDFSRFHPQWLHQRLKVNREYRLQFADHVYKHFYNGGALTVNRVQKLFKSSADKISLAIIAESARWGDLERSKDRAWQPAVNEILNSFFPYRAEIVLDQLKEDHLYPSFDPPVFKHNGKLIQNPTLDMGTGIELEMANVNDNNGEVIYTLDGSDPRLIAGAVSENALNGGKSTKISLSSTTKIKARVLFENEWSAVHELILIYAQPIDLLKLTEIHYHPMDGDTTDNREFEFLEFKNISAQRLHLALLSFKQGISYVFPANTVIEPQNHIVLASNAKEFNNRYHFEAFAAYEGHLDNQGDRIVLVDAKRDTLIDVTYSSRAPWPSAADGDGYSLVPVDSNGVRDPNNPGNWVASAQIHGSPGKDDAASTEKNQPPIIPIQFILYQNYPNPFNHSTTITFYVVYQEKVQIVVFNILGQKISTLCNEVFAPGRYSLQWNGVGHASGIYFFQLRAGNNIIQTKKMILCK